MAARPRIGVVFGTRPEAIKMAPIVRALQQSDDLDCWVCVTGQHREMLDAILPTFGIKPDVDLDVMQPDQSLPTLTARMLSKLDAQFQRNKLDLLLVQGDTTTAFAAALTAFYSHVPVGHVEAGLRTYNLEAPWPEEGNRQLISRLASLHFAPTATTRDNLLKEQIAPEKVYVTGNTVVDALQFVEADIRRHPPTIDDLPDGLLESNRPMVLITCHRRENFGERFVEICKAIETLARQHPDVWFVFPVHLNPAIRSTVDATLRQSEMPNVVLLEPLGYREFIMLFQRASLLLSDSGGVQEEAPALAKRVLLMRDTTERPEAVECGSVILGGTNMNEILNTVSELLANPLKLNHEVSNPYGDGNAATKIVTICREFVVQKCYHRHPIC